MVLETTETDRWTEYEFTLGNGQKRYEIVDYDCDLSPARQIAMFMKMHGATRCVAIGIAERRPLPLFDTLD